MSRRRLSRRPDLLRWFALSLLGVAALAGARTSDRSQPMNVEADGSDCSISDTGQCVLTGNVHITQGTMVIQAGRAVVHRANGDIRRVQFTGSPVNLTQELDDGSTIKARAQNVDYDMATDTVVFTGDALIDQPGRGNISGGRIAYNMRSGQVQGTGEGDKGRVRMQFQPKQQGSR
ncbi:lipopolysaccharide transport periplasmic protein LptA [Noviluteimonas gilva]|uniref:Lipopolysaccharide export system protein LptA n=1 Tax=Noviluteimonas gilva TaxID=2682097 RepID=A0A7C9LJE9_9GAMM|nr:lipopolysaccharide transport periplasmic protein LptA [Lysobacter gilvus]MUV15620.1 lipopolysaccharide transport periplasmic protein LptA [Lysobacter gilvus]